MGVFAIYHQTDTITAHGTSCMFSSSSDNWQGCHPYSWIDDTWPRGSKYRQQSIFLIHKIFFDSMGMYSYTYIQYIFIDAHWAPANLGTHKSSLKVTFPKLLFTCFHLCPAWSNPYCTSRCLGMRIYSGNKPWRYARWASVSRTYRSVPYPYPHLHPLHPPHGLQSKGVYPQSDESMRGGRR